jgi:hypothetical protein
MMYHIVYLCIYLINQLSFYWRIVNGYNTYREELIVFPSVL